MSKYNFSLFVPSFSVKIIIVIHNRHKQKPFMSNCMIKSLIRTKYFFSRFHCFMFASSLFLYYFSSSLNRNFLFFLLNYDHEINLFSSINKPELLERQAVYSVLFYFHFLIFLFSEGKKEKKFGNNKCRKKPRNVIRSRNSHKKNIVMIFSSLFLYIFSYFILFLSHSK